MSIIGKWKEEIKFYISIYISFFFGLNICFRDLFLRKRFEHCSRTNEEIKFNFRCFYCILSQRIEYLESRNETKNLKI